MISALVASIYGLQQASQLFGSSRGISRVGQLWRKLGRYLWWPSWNRLDLTGCRETTVILQIFLFFFGSTLFGVSAYKIIQSQNTSERKQLKTKIPSEIPMWKICAAYTKFLSGLWQICIVHAYVRVARGGVKGMKWRMLEIEPKFVLSDSKCFKENTRWKRNVMDYLYTCS